MNRIYSGGMTRVTPDIVRDVRQKVSEACEELLDIGARIRPLFVGHKRIGWVRGVHITERKQLSTWFQGTEFVENVLLLGTSLTREQLDALTGSEVFTLAKLVKEMTERDLTLAPYMTAYSTTSTSEFQWCGKGTDLTSFQNKVVALPDGARITIMTPAHHAKLWATLCTHREQNKSRLDAMMNAAMIVRPWVGKQIDGFASDLKTSVRLMQPDAIEPWENVVQTQATNVEDGWGHPDDSVGGLLRELKGMLSHDKHERVMEAFMRQQVASAEAESTRLETLVAKRGGPGVEQKEGFVILTREQVRAREKAMRKGRPVPRDMESVEKPSDKIKRYQ